MATRLLFVSVPKTHPKTKSSQHRTPFSAVATSRFLQISRLQASKTLETIYEEDMPAISSARLEGVADVLTSAAATLPSVSASFLLASRSTCFVQKQKHLSKKSDNFRCAYGSN